MEIEVLSPARAEFREAIGYYNGHRAGLGFEFAGEVKQVIERIVQFPEAWAFLSRRVRRCRVSRFPYAVLYQAMEGTLLIVAVMHLHREPDLWKAWLKSGE